MVIFHFAHDNISDFKDTNFKTVISMIINSSPQQESSSLECYRSPSNVRVRVDITEHGGLLSLSDTLKIDIPYTFYMMSIESF